MDRKIMATRQNISEASKIFQTHAPPPRRLKFTIGTQALRINQMVKLDTIFINSKTVLHKVYVATHFCSGGFLRPKSTEETWNAALENSIHIFADPRTSTMWTP